MESSETSLWGRATTSLRAMRTIGLPFVPRGEEATRTLETFLQSERGELAVEFLEELGVAITLLKRRYGKRFLAVFLDSNGVAITFRHVDDRRFRREECAGPVRYLHEEMLGTFLDPRTSRRSGGPDLVRYIEEVLDETATDVLDALAS